MDTHYPIKRIIITLILAVPLAGCLSLPQKVLDQATDRGCELKSVNATKHRVALECK